MQLSNLPHTLTDIPNRSAAEAHMRSAKAWAAALIRRLIEAQHLTQAAAAVQIGTNKTRISKLKNRELHTTSLVMMLTFLERLGATVSTTTDPPAVRVTWTTDGHVITETYHC